MTRFHKRHDTYPRSRYRSCEVCYKPLTQPARGRTRTTCSPACRQRLYRDRRRLLTYDQRQLDLDRRRADRTLADLEQRYGRFSDVAPMPGDLSPRVRLHLRLQRGIPSKTCKVCGRPILDAGYTRRYCSPSCRYRAHRLRRAYRFGLYDRGVRYAPAVIDHLRRQQSMPLCRHCGLPFVPASRLVPTLPNALGRESAPSGAQGGVIDELREGTSAQGGALHGLPDHTVKPPRGRPPIYCSQRCRKAAYWRRKHPPMIRRAICPGCGSRFTIRHPLQKFCTRACGARTRRAARYARYARTRFWGKCIVCDARIEPPSRRRPGHHQMYCSGRCRLCAFRMRRKQRAEAALGRKIRRCAWCGQALGWQAHALRKYCSKHCRWNAANHRRP